MACLALIPLLAGIGIVVVPAGMAGGRVSQISGTIPGTLYPGLHLVCPLVQSVALYDTRDQIFQTAIGSKTADVLKVQTREGLSVGLAVAVRYRIDELTPVYAEQRARLQRLLDEHYAEGTAVRWDDDRVHACLRCPVCEEQVRATDDLLLGNKGTLLRGDDTVRYVAEELHGHRHAPDAAVLAAVTCEGPACLLNTDIGHEVRAWEQSHNCLFVTSRLSR